MFIWQNVVGARLGLADTGTIADHNTLTQQQSNHICIDVVLVLTIVSRIQLAKHLL
jgi:hypothetical protein